MRRTRVTATMTVTCLLAGCGASSPSDQVRAKVDQFVHAAASQDYRTICRQVLDVSFLERIAASGITCEGVMELAFAQRPSLSVGRVVVTGASASVDILSSGAGKSGIVGIGLLKTGGGWRINTLRGATLGG